MEKNEERVERFNLAERLGHWAHAVSCSLLLLTGLPLVFNSFGNMFDASVLRVFSKIHHLMGYAFIFLALVILLIGTPKTFLAWIAECFRWSGEDRRFILSFPKEFFGLKAELPKQGKFNAGEKLNSIITMTGFIVMSVTGWVMLHPENFSQETLLIAYPLHSAGAMIIGAVLIGHIYLAILHPNSRESIRGMLEGTVSKKFAQEHHALWYEEINRKTSG